MSSVEWRRERRWRKYCPISRLFAATELCVSHAPLKRVYKDQKVLLCTAAVFLCERATKTRARPLERSFWWLLPRGLISLCAHGENFLRSCHDCCKYKEKRLDRLKIWCDVYTRQQQQDHYVQSARAIVLCASADCFALILPLEPPFVSLLNCLCARVNLWSALFPAIIQPQLHGESFNVTFVDAIHLPQHTARVYFIIPTDWVAAAAGKECPLSPMRERECMCHPRANKSCNSGLFYLQAFLFCLQKWQKSAFPWDFAKTPRFGT